MEIKMNSSIIQGLKGLGKNMKNLIIGISLLIITSGLSFAGNGESALSFMKRGVGARPNAMANSFVAVADDVNSVYWNPAGLTQIQHGEVGLMHMQTFEDTKYNFLGYSQKLNDKLAIGIHGIYYDYGSFDKTGEDGSGNYDSSVSGSFSAYDALVGVSLAYRMVPALSIGLTVKEIEEKIDSHKDNAIAGDCGVLLKTPLSGLSLAANVQNFGGKMGDDKLPTNLKTGFSYRVNAKKAGDLLIAGAADIPMDGSENILPSVGLEYVFMNVLALRGGYVFNHDVESFTAGTGFILNVSKSVTTTIDYAFSTSDDLNDSHRISLGFKF